MDILIRNPQIKNITFEAYEKYFQEALKLQDATDYSLIFYNKQPDGILVSFNSEIFIVQFFVSYEKIEEIYKDSNMQTGDVVLSDREEGNTLIKFINDFLHNRAIEEVSDAKE